jgi:hypothetical protein
VLYWLWLTEYVSLTYNCSYLCQPELLLINLFFHIFIPFFPLPTCNLFFLFLFSLYLFLFSYSILFRTTVSSPSSLHQSFKIFFSFDHLIFFSFLTGSDPATFELLQKIQTLQRRLISKTEEVSAMLSLFWIALSCFTVCSCAMVNEDFTCHVLPYSFFMMFILSCVLSVVYGVLCYGILQSYLRSPLSTILSNTTQCNFLFVNFIISHLILSYLISSHLISSHLTSSHLISSHPILYSISSYTRLTLISLLWSYRW